MASKKPPSERQTPHHQSKTTMKQIAYKKKSKFFVLPIAVMSLLSMIFAFQNCQGSHTGGSVTETTLTPSSANEHASSYKSQSSESQTETNLRLVAKLANQTTPQYNFAVGDEIHFELWPSTHDLLTTASSFLWHFQQKFWDDYHYARPYLSKNKSSSSKSGGSAQTVACPAICQIVIDDEGQETCVSPCDDGDHSPIFPPEDLPLLPFLYKYLETTAPKTSFTFEKVGVYDISVGFQKSFLRPVYKPFPHPVPLPENRVPGSAVSSTSTSSSSSTTVLTEQVMEEYGPDYMTSIVIGKCSGDQLRIVKSEDPVIIPSQSQKNRLSIAPTSTIKKTKLYATTFALELNGKPLDIGYPGIVRTPTPTATITTTSSTTTRTTASSTTSLASNEREPDRLSMRRYTGPTYVPYRTPKVKWRLLGEVESSKYGRWYREFAHKDSYSYYGYRDEEVNIWQISWNHIFKYVGGWVLSLYEPSDYPDDGKWVELTASGNFFIEAFVQLPDADCIHSAGLAFQLPQEAIIIPNPITEESVPGHSGGGSEGPNEMELHETETPPTTIPSSSSTTTTN